MNYRRLFNILQPELNCIKLIGGDFGTGIVGYTTRYPEGISICTDEHDDIVVETGDSSYNFHGDTIKAVSFFVSRCHKEK